MYTFNYLFQGCFLSNIECQGQKLCKNIKEEIKPNSYMFCCCEGDLCNSKFHWDPVPTTPRFEPCKYQILLILCYV